VPDVPDPGSSEPDTTAPRVSVEVYPLRAERPARAPRALVTRVRSSEPCQARVTVELDGFALGRARFAMEPGHARRVVVRFSPRARVRLRRARPATVRLLVDARDRSGNSTLVSRHVLFDG
jgi:hypothetical protein